MARAGTFILDSGDKFPQLAMDTVRHGHLILPDALARLGCLSGVSGALVTLL